MPKPTPPQPQQPPKVPPVSRARHGSLALEVRVSAAVWAASRPRLRWCAAMVSASDRRTIAEWDVWAAAIQSREVKS